MSQFNKRGLRQWVSVASLRTKPLAPAIAAAALAVVIVVLRLGLWNYDLTVPFLYWGDGLFFETLVKSLTESGRYYHISRLAAPFGMDVVDFPLGCTLDFTLMKMLSWCISNPFLLINVYWLLSIALAGAGACLFLRSLRLTSGTSIVFAVLFAIIPFVFFRNLGHLNLVIFIVPAGAYLALSLAEGRVYPFVRSTFGTDIPGFTWRSLVLSLTLCTAIGLTYIYWAFFSSALICLACTIGYVRFRNHNIVLSALLYVLIIGIASVADIAPTLRYWYQHGPNSALSYKSPAETDVYGLRIRQLLTPIPQHPLPPWRAFARKITTAGFKYDANETMDSALGTLGSIGFLLLLFVLLTGAKGKVFRDPRIRLLASLTFGLVLLAEVGGIGSIFNIFVTDQFRCYNRVSPFLSLFSFGALAVAADCGMRLVPFARLALLSLLMIFGAVDQIPLVLFSHRAALEHQFRADQASIQNLEQLMPPNAMIFELPDTTFPLDPGANRLLPYDNARPYLHSHRVKWSWGSMMGRHKNWSHAAAQLPVDKFLKKIISAGFDGLLLDRAGYADRTKEQELRARVSPGAVHELNARWLLLDLRPSTQPVSAGTAIMRR